MVISWTPFLYRKYYILSVSPPVLVWIRMPVAWFPAVLLPEVLLPEAPLSVWIPKRLYLLWTLFPVHRYNRNSESGMKNYTPDNGYLGSFRSQDRRRHCRRWHRYDHYSSRLAVRTDQSIPLPVYIQRFPQVYRIWSRRSVCRHCQVP